MDFKQEVARKAEEIKKKETDVPESPRKNILIRLLKASEIECRVSKVTQRGVSLLLYKDARVDQKILDETFGMFGWKRSHQMIDGNLYCTVEVYEEKTGQWVSKQDVGIAGVAEKEKAQASDSFKRACFNWGIGRELYTAPFIWVPAEAVEIRQNGDRWCCNDSFSVREIAYNAEREICQLVIVNKKGTKVYQMRTMQMIPAETGITLSDAKLQALNKELERTGVDLNMVKERYPFEKMETMTEAVYQKIMKALEKTPSAVMA